MRVLVFGASGFVGQNVVKELGDLGLDVTATDIIPIDISLGENVNFVKADILDAQHLDDLIEGQDVIIHFATSNLRTSLKNPKRNINAKG